MTVGGDLYQFGPFRLDPEAGILYRGPSRPCWGSAPSRCCAGCSKRGLPVSKDALVEAGWGDWRLPITI